MLWQTLCVALTTLALGYFAGAGQSTASLHELTQYRYGEALVATMSSPADAYGRAQRVLNDSLTSGVWTQKDQIALDNARAHLSAIERDAIQGRLAGAINAELLEIRSHHPAF